LDRLRLLHVLEDPIADFAVSDAVAYYLDELLGLDAGGLQPQAVKALAKIGLVIRMQFAGQVEADLVNEPRQVHPAAHGLARAPGINNLAHAFIIRAGPAGVNRG